jgi:2-polyprenyl-3-methyl-5-hydroxy-6-metoxy-1,4-benzoquinol methylase
MEEHKKKPIDFDDEKSKKYNLHVATSEIKRHVFLYTQHQLAADVHGLKILDIGCGDGQAYRSLLERGASEATACDISALMLQACKQTDKQLGLQEKVHYVLTDATDGHLFESGPFDVVLCNFVLNLIDTEESLRQLIQILFMNCTNQGKVLAISTIGALPEGKREYIAKECGAIHPLLPAEGLANFTPCPVILFPDIEVMCYYTPIQFMIDVFKQIGFSHVASQPWRKDPKYSGDRDLDQIILNDSAYIIEAKK